jgi:hypothetical protein
VDHHLFHGFNKGTQSHLIHEFIIFKFIKLKIIFFFQDQLGSADVSQNEYDQILMGDNSSNVVGIENFRTIDRKKEEQRARNREYQRQYQERKRIEAAQITGSEANIRAANREYQRRYREKKETKRLRSLAVRQISPLYALGLDGMKIFFCGVKKC